MSASNQISTTSTSTQASIQVSPLAAQIIAGRAQRQSPPSATRQALPTAMPGRHGLVHQEQASLAALAGPTDISVVRPSQEITHSGGETTQEIYSLLKKSVTRLRNAMVETAYFAYQLAARDEWSKLGFEDEEACRESLGLAESTWATYLLLGERLSSLTLDQMRELSVGCCRLITTISAKIWDEYAWVEEARVLSTREFSALVGQRNRDWKIAGRVGVAEPRAALTVQVPISQQQGLEQRIESLRRVRRLRSSSEALDQALAAAEREPVVVSQIELLAKAAAELERVWEMLPQESAEEKEERYARGEGMNSVAEAASRTLRLTRKMLKVVKELGWNGDGSGVSDKISQAEETYSVCT
jgi:hypothetical protein